MKNFAVFVGEKGKVKPAKWRAYGYKPPFNPIAQLKTGLHSWKLRFGKPPLNSSPWIQQRDGLNKDTTLHSKKSEGKKLRQ